VGRFSQNLPLASRAERAGVSRLTWPGEPGPFHNCLAQPRPVEDGTRAGTASETILATTQTYGSATRITRNTVREEATKNHGSFIVRALDFRGHITVRRGPLSSTPTSCRNIYRKGLDAKNLVYFAAPEYSAKSKPLFRRVERTHRWHCRAKVNADDLPRIAVTQQRVADESDISALEAGQQHRFSWISSGYTRLVRPIVIVRHKLRWVINFAELQHGIPLRLQFDLAEVSD
jgi:hypothetical protein